MNKFQQWFNELSLAQQKKALVIFCLLFATILVCSICNQQLRMNTGGIQQPRIKTYTPKNR